MLRPKQLVNVFNLMKDSYRNFLNDGKPLKPYCFRENSAAMTEILATARTVTIEDSTPLPLTVIPQAAAVSGKKSKDKKLSSEKIIKTIKKQTIPDVPLDTPVKTVRVKPNRVRMDLSAFKVYNTQVLEKANLRMCISRFLSFCRYLYILSFTRV